MTVPFAGADANTNELDPVPETLYDLTFWNQMDTASHHLMQLRYYHY